MSDFIQQINVPSLTSPTFASDLSEAFENINENFERLASAPYLEGQEGMSVVPVDMEIVSDDGSLTNFGLSMVRAIFDSDTIRSIADIDNVAPPVAQYRASDYLRLNRYVKVFGVYSPDTGQIERYVCSAEYYLYIDMRIDGLNASQYPSNYGDVFEDYTCQMFGTYTDGQWTFSKGVMLPTLYYEPSKNYFCWKVNDMQTGIRAQGPKGDDGRPPVAAVVRGAGRSNAGKTQIVVQEFWNGTGWSQIASSGLGNGDLVCCTFSITDPATGKDCPDMVIANISVQNEYYKIDISDTARLSRLWKSYLMYYSMSDIDYKASDGKTTKAMFVPAADEDVVHAIFQDDSGVIYHQDGTVTDDSRNNDLVFKKTRKSRIIGDGSIGNQNKMTSPDSYDAIEGITEARFERYKVVSNVNGVEGITLGVPVGCVMSWIDKQNIPDGWFLTGEDTGEYVFALRNEDSDPDIVFESANGQRFKMAFYSMSEGQLLDRDSRFLPIFCILTGNVPGNTSPSTIYIGGNTTVQQYVSTRWRFRYDADGSTIKFKLTKN